MIHERKYLYGRESVNGNEELDYLKTQITSSNFRVDRPLTVTDSTAYRPDLLSKIAFGNYHYGWLLMDFNNILDPYTELYTGRVINVPDISEYFQWYSNASKISKKSRRGR